MNKKTNRKSSFVVHDIFRAVFVLALTLASSVLANTLTSSSASALPYISVSSDSNVTITGDDAGGYVAPSASGTLGVGLDHVNIATDCSAGYKLYVSGTNSGTTDLVRTDAEDPTDTTNRIPTSATATGSENQLSKNTWGVGKDGSLFAELQGYNSDSSLWTPLYTGTDNNTFDVYYGVNISTEKQPGIYAADVLYTAILDDACLKYTLNFDTSSATTVDTSAFESRTIDYGTNVDLSAFSDATLISRTGYDLAGWKYTVSGMEYEFITTTNDNINPLDFNNITLVPVWEPISYYILYEPGETGGTCGEEFTSVRYDSDVTLADITCNKLGYTQDGWSTSPDINNSKDYNLSQTLEKPNFANIAGGSYVLYPHFSINHPLLTINNGDTAAIASVSPETGEVEYNTEITATCIANTGYHCTGWTSADEDVLPSTVAVNYTFNMPDSPVTLTANASPNTYTIRYNGNGGTGETESQTGQAYDSTTTLRESGFLRSGHHFVGWAYSDTAEEPDFTGGQTGVSISALAENNATGSVVDTNGGTIDLYAIWDVNNYTFVFDVNGGTGSPASASSSASYDGIIVPPGVGTMEKEKFEFIGWSLDPTSESEDYSANVSYNASTIASAAGKTTENNAEITLYAVWSGYPYTLTTVNGNTTAISSISPSGNTTKRYGSSTTVTCTPNSGYHCTGWTSNDTNKLPNSSNASYTFSMPENITLTASGAANTYTIKYNANGGSGTTESQTNQTYGSTTTLRANGFSRTGYTFLGWAYDSSATNKDFNASQSNVSIATLASNNKPSSVVGVNGGTINLYAVWQVQYYTLSVSNGYINSTGSTSGSFTYNDRVYVCNSSPGTYYDFSYWSSNNGGSFSSQYSSCTYFTMPSNNVTITANYSYNPPTYYTLRITNGYLGTSGTSTSGSYTAGSTVTIRASSPGTYYSFSNWSSNNGGSFASRYSTTTTFTMPSNDVTVTANYDYNPPTYYTVTINKGTGISSVSGAGSYTAGSRVNISASASTGYSFSSWTVNSGSISTPSGSSTSFTMPSGNVTLTANAQVNTYTVTINKGNCISSVSGAGTYSYNSTVYISATSSSNCDFSSWTVNSGSISTPSGASTSFSMPAGNVTLTANGAESIQDCSATVHPTTTTPCRMGDGALYIWGNNKNKTTFRDACTNITGSVNHEATCTGCPSGYSWVTKKQMTSLSSLMKPSVVYKYLGEGSITFWSSTEYNTTNAFKIMIASNAVTPSSAGISSASHYVFCRKN